MIGGAGVHRDRVAAILAAAVAVELAVMLMFAITADGQRGDAAVIMFGMITVATLLALARLYSGNRGE